jgi:hypothetical protein
VVFLPVTSGSSYGWLMDLSVEGLPPKKDGANSMWAKNVEVRRLKALRMAALAAIADRPGFPLTVPVELEFTVWAQPRAGDLDNFLTGICDGLMAKHPRAAWKPEVWLDVPPAAAPDQALVLADDRLVARIVAERLEPAGAGERYRLRLRPLAVTD